MKLKFKVGDRIRFVKSIITHSDKVQVGEAYEIIEIDSSNIPYKVENGEWFREDELELVTTTFTKSDLKDGDIVIQRNGGKKRYCTNREGFVGIDGDSYLAYSNYKENLLDKDGDEIYDIVKVERPTYETVFERKEEILDNTEKNYLRSVIRPFRDRVKTIEKDIIDDMDDMDNGEYISINFEDFLDSFSLPTFKKGTMYKGMKLNKKYTLEELGL